MIVSCEYEKNKNVMAISLANVLLKHREKPVFLCVGTSKVVADAVGAIVGELLINKYNINAHVYGSLDSNVSATNLENTISHIKSAHPHSPIVLIDAILGDLHELGQVKFYERGAYAKGAFQKGVYVGDYSILGVVDVKGISALNLIKNEKLNGVVKISKFIAESVNRAFVFCNNLCG